jgi:hypothetical protein
MLSQEIAKDISQEVAKDMPQETTKDMPQETTKDMPQRAAKDIPQRVAKGIHFIKAECHQTSRATGFQLASNYIKKSYDFAITEQQFKDGQGYQMLDDHITSLASEIRVITVGGDYTICKATVSAAKKRCGPNLKIVYIGNQSDVKLNDEQIILFGVSDEEVVDDTVSFTFKKIKQIGIDDIISIVKELLADSSVHICLNMGKIRKSVEQTDEGVELSDLLKLLNAVKQKVVSIDITEFNPSVATSDDIQTIKSAAIQCLTGLFNIKEKQINIFTENTQFLIYRPIKQLDPLCDYGWYILKGLAIDDREMLLKTLPDDTITTIIVDNTDYLLTKTTMAEQNGKSCFTTTLVEDCVLFPDEKKTMCFELVDSSMIDGSAYEESDPLDKETDSDEFDDLDIAWT